jgi:hypothetical protein
MSLPRRSRRFGIGAHRRREERHVLVRDVTYAQIPQTARAGGTSALQDDAAELLVHHSVTVNK